MKFQKEKKEEEDSVIKKKNHLFMQLNLVHMRTWNKLIFLGWFHSTIDL